MNGAVILFSGGLDSTVCLHMAAKRFGRSQVRALFVDYGQRHGPRELEAAVAIVETLGVPFDIVAVTIPWWRAAGLVGGGDVTGSAAVVPGRNTILATLAAAHAQKHGHAEVWIGCCENDALHFPDCRPLWSTAMSQVLIASTGVALAAPVIGLSKRAIVDMGTRYGAGDAMRRSWSCYTPTDSGEQCGACGACVQRASGFGGT